MLAQRVLLLSVVLALVAAPADANAGKRRVPFGFFGTVYNDAQRVTDATLDAQMAKMASSGVESVRTGFYWPAIEVAPGVFDFRETDRIALAAARHGLDLLPILLYTPQWASSRPSHPRYHLYAPRSPQLMASFARALVERYGPRGSFWPKSGTRRVAIRSWQVWNEPAANFYWATRPWPSSYVPVLRAVYRAIRGVDRRATVVLASLAGVTNSTPWVQLRQLYRAGAKGYFNVHSAHFFSSAPSVRLTGTQTLEIVRLLRAEMRRARDRRKKVWFTELTWTAAKGKIPRNQEFGFETTPRGQAARLRSVFSRLARERKRLGVGRVYWYSWSSDYLPVGGGAGTTFNYAGLNKIDSAYNYQPLSILRTYAATAARFQGCRKSTHARRCRR